MFHPVPLYIGLRYTRAKRRNHFISFISGISMVGIALGIIALIVVLSVMNGFHKEIQQRILAMTSHATLTNPYGGIANWQEVLSQVRAHPHVVGAAPFVEIQGMLTSGAQVSGAVVRAIEPVEEDEVADLRQHMLIGSVDDLVDGEFNIILGRDLANYLGVWPGDKVTVVTPQVSSTPIGVVPRLKRFTVSGLFAVGMADYDRNAAFIHLADGARLMGLGEAVGGLRLKLDDLWQAPRLVREIAYELGGIYRLVDWTQVHRNFFSALAMEKRMMGLILFLIVAVAAFNIVSTLVMVVTDKQSDIAVLRTLGMSPAGVMGIFMVQGTAIGLIGTLVGMVAGVLLALNVEPVVAGIEGLFGVHFLDPDIYYISDLPSDVHLADVLRIGGGAFLMSVLATLYPAWQAAKTQPAEALRYE
ncbi:MAG: lipoprotein-releasing ABC transporter permease subunit [Thermochromatium sp.]